MCKENLYSLLKNFMFCRVLGTFKKCYLKRKIDCPGHPTFFLMYLILISVQYQCVTIYHISRTIEFWKRSLLVAFVKFHKIFDLLLSVGPLDDIKSILAHFPSLVPLWTPISLIRSSFFGVKLICSSFNAKLQPLLLLGHQFDLQHREIRSCMVGLSEALRKDHGVCCQSWFFMITYVKPNYWFG